MTNLERIRKQLSPARRRKIAARAHQLITENEPPKPAGRKRHVHA